MVMTQNRTADNRQIRIGTHKIMRKLFYEIKQLTERVVLYLHRNMSGVENDTMLVIIYIRRILESPSASVNRYGYDSVILPCRMIDPARITFIFHAEKTLRIAALLRVFCRRNRFRVLLRFGKINGNIQITVLRRCNPFLVFFDAVSSDIIRVLAQLIEIIRRFLRALFILC